MKQIFAPAATDLERGKGKTKWAESWERKSPPNLLLPIFVFAGKMRAMPDNAASRAATLNRRNFLRMAAFSAAGVAVCGTSRTGLAEEFVTMPFDNGQRPLVKYPQKRPLIRITTRPPQLETP